MYMEVGFNIFTTKKNLNICTGKWNEMKWEYNYKRKIQKTKLISESRKKYND